MYVLYANVCREDLSFDMKKILVALHIYYHDHVEYYIDKLANINGCQWDLVVTYSEYSAATEEKLKAFRPDVRLVKTENAGYDLWPFIKALRLVDISSYDYILKLHTKNTDVFKWKANGLRMKGNKWRNTLVDALLKTPEQFRRCLDLFERHPDTGMVCSYELLVGLTQRRREDLSMLRDEAARIGIGSVSGKFCAGTMFLVKAECMKKIRDSYVDADSWPSYSRSHSKGTLAHVYERLLSFAVSDSGYRIRTLAAYRKNVPSVFIHNTFSPVLKSLFTIDRHGEDERKYLTILGIRIPLS